MAVTHVWRKENRAAALDKGGGAADRYCEGEKESQANQNKKDALEMGYEYQPLVLDTAGAWDHGAVKWLRRLGGMLATANNITKTQGCERVFQKLSITLQRVQARAILERRPYLMGVLEEDEMQEEYPPELLDAEDEDGVTDEEASSDDSDQK